MRDVLLVLHTGRPTNRKTALHVMGELGRLGLRTRV
ncbi:NAD(+) kinase, partial [Pseudonocardia sp. SID8383]|nr:NAD(+) kinase [Pseudonocardia sp. SID8383]